MPKGITLRVVRGRLEGEEYTFTKKTSLVLGRQEDCGIVLPDAKISRRHCALEIDPPYASVRDLHSRNGTYLNDVLIGGGEELSSRPAALAAGGTFSLWDGDRLGIGKKCELVVESPYRSNLDLVQIEGYRKLESLGKGAMANVWRVEETASGRQFAMKLVPMFAQMEPRLVEKGLREAHMARQLQHPNIVRQVESGISGETFFMLQEICEGGTVDDWVRAQNGMPLHIKTATHIILQVLDALTYAHHAPVHGQRGGAKNGVVHRDIKPGNILLLNRAGLPHAKLADFGLSKIYELSRRYDPTLPEEFSATPEFTPRAQILDYLHAKPEVDVWAAAATYYFMLTGSPPKDLRFGAKWKMALITEAIPIRERNPSVPAALAGVIDAALQEEPEIGCRSAAELKNKIQQAL